jgi:CRISPR system Cascade subunit CasA
MENEKTEFNLLDEPWIRVIMKNGESMEMGILEIIKNAHLIRQIAGETSAQDICILRLILAILYASEVDRARYDSIECEDDAVDLWAELWSKGHLDYDRIASYLNAYRDRFYLFGDQPFYQANIDKGTEYSVYKLIGDLSESDNKPRLFSQLSKSNLDHLSFPESARWLLHLISFDDTSAKPSVRGQSMPSPGAGWLGKLGLVYAEGDSLFETLLLNLVLTDSRGEPYPIDERPFWEKPICADERIEVPVPSNQMSLFTVQCRRILLKRDDEGVNGFLLLGGDVFGKINVFTETMTEWRFDEKENHFIPKRHDLSRHMWRDFSSLTTASDSAVPPGIVRWASVLKERDVYPNRSTRIVAVGIHYADKDFFADGSIQDSLSFNSELLTKTNRAITERISMECIPRTLKCVDAVGSFARNLGICNGYDPKNDANRLNSMRDEAKEQCFYMIDRPFRDWLSSFDPSDTENISQYLNDWYSELKSIVMKQGNRLFDEAGLTAIKGKSFSNNSSAKYSFFVNTVNKILRGEL